MAPAPACPPASANAASLVPAHAATQPLFELTARIPRPQGQSHQDRLLSGLNGYLDQRDRDCCIGMRPIHMLQYRRRCLRCWRPIAQRGVSDRVEVLAPLLDDDFRL